MVSTMKIVDTKKAALKSGSTSGVRVNRTGRRTYTAEYKRNLVQECSEPGVSVAGVALAHGINANQLHKWRKILRTSWQRAGAASTPDPGVDRPRRAGAATGR